VIVDHPNPPGPFVITCDVSLVGPDPSVLDTLARLQLAARRLGTTIRLHNASPALVDLITIAGLGDILVVVDSGVEMERKVEEREQVGVDEEVHGGDGAA